MSFIELQLSAVRGAKKVSVRVSVKTRTTHFFFAAMFYIYILYSDSADRYYIGHTNDPDRRLTLFSHTSHSHSHFLLLVLRKVYEY